MTLRRATIRAAFPYSGPVSTQGAAGFDAFVELRSAELLRTAHLLCGDRHEAEQVLGQALARSWRSWRRAHSDVAAHNLVLRMLVSAARSHTPPAPATGLLPAGLGTDQPEQVAARVALRSVLATLSADERAVLVLRHAELLPVERVAAIVGLSEQQVEVVERSALAHVSSRPELVELAVA